jgi:hypothetical protein
MFLIYVSLNLQITRCLRIAPSAALVEAIRKAYCPPFLYAVNALNGELK